MDTVSSHLDPFFTIPPYQGLPRDVSDTLTAISDHRIILRDQEHRVVFFGASKTGKSALINALLGNELLPDRAHGSSGTVATIQHGSTPLATIVRPNLPDQAIPIGETADMLQRDHAHDRRTDELRVELVHPLLANRCVIVDTPGLFGDEAFTEHAQREIERADLGVMVLAADKILSARERDSATWAASLLNGNVIYVVNRLDLIDRDDEEELLDWAHDALRESGNELVGRPRIFATSSKGYEGIAELGWWLTELMGSGLADHIAVHSRLGVLEFHLREAQYRLAPHLEAARLAAQHAHDEHDADIARERAAIRGEIAQARVRLHTGADGLAAVGERFIERCVDATRQCMQDGTERPHRVPVQYREALALYVEAIGTVAQEALVGSPVTAPAFDLSGWIFRDWVDPATHPTSELGVTLGDLATRVIDGGSAGREAGANLGSWVGKNVFRVDVERETNQRIRRVAAAAEQSLRHAAQEYIDRTDRLLADADGYYVTWTRVSAQVAAAEEVERMYESLVVWLDAFLEAVQRSLLKVPM